MSPTEFTNGPALSGLLVQEESFSLLMNISSPGVAPIPSPFCQILKRRIKVQVSAPPATAPSSSRSSAVGQNVQLRCVCAGDILAGILVNEQLLDCMLSFSVDRDVCIYGVEMPTQYLQQNLPEQPQPPPQETHECYSELIYAFLQDSDGCRITYTHFTARVPYSSSVEVMFNRPVYIVPNKVYRIGVVLNKLGRYPVHIIIPYVTVNECTFTFDRDRSRNGLITAVIFGYFSPEPTPRQDHPWMPMY